MKSAFDIEYSYLQFDLEPAMALLYFFLFYAVQMIQIKKFYCQNLSQKFMF